MKMDSAKTAMLLSLGFSAGLVYMIACEEGPSRAGARGSSGSSGRVVLTLTHNATDDECSYFSKAVACCPEGFTFVGSTKVSDKFAAVCLEN